MRILGLAGLAVLLLGTGCSQTSAVKTCREDLRNFTEETDAYDAEYSTLYGPAVISQRPIEELMHREQMLSACMSTDSSNSEQYKSELYRLGFIESSRFLKYVVDTQQEQKFGAWEKKEQAAELASRR